MLSYSKIFNKEVKAADRRKRKGGDLGGRGEAPWACVSSDEGPEEPRPHWGEGYFAWQKCVEPRVSNFVSHFYPDHQHSSSHNHGLSCIQGLRGPVTELTRIRCIKSSESQSSDVLSSVASVVFGFRKCVLTLPVRNYEPRRRELPWVFTHRLPDKDTH